ncbi:LysR family transcriptional regulator [Prosthecomicrobium pneumaticum]|uniref:DNA-binding transcriptional LysR family regulator n=1 Tax=Prosthecomicrobium pneumaticum TaxID=81895 RepID=A0A7W9FPA2_9HYPH|nr:LysR family transcriptional regulator [Prosthecomicrobium pneumaticum]MBB5754384.1 DNA-binding transcriptional LysR family regulator [Prosthecomicrobium pneumaticum]
MDETEPDWDLYRSFLAVLEEGSLSGAARALGLTQPTIGRHIEALEAALGRQLFIRTPLGLAPTDVAQAMRPYASALAATAAALRRTASEASDRVAGVVRVTASEVIGVEVLPPLLTTLHERHPDLIIELVLSNAVDDLLRREADVAVRMTAPTQEALLVRRVGAIPIGLYGHRRYLERRGRPKTIDDLAGHALIGFDRETAWLRTMAARYPYLGRERLAFRATSDLAQLAAIRAGYGIGACQVGIARRDPNLERVLADFFDLPLGTFVAMHEDLRTSPRCRAVFDALAAGLADYLAACGGTPASR